MCRLHILAFKQLGQDSTLPYHFNMSSTHVGRKHFPRVLDMESGEPVVLLTHNTHDNEKFSTGKSPSPIKLVNLCPCRFAFVYF